MERKLIRLCSYRLQRVMSTTVMQVGLRLTKFKNLSHISKDSFRRKFCYYSKVRSLKKLLLEKISYIKSPTLQRFSLVLSDSRPIRIKNIFKNYCYYDNRCHEKRKKQTFYSKKKLKQLKNNKVKIVRRCLYTDRTRGMFRSYNLSRNVFRDLMQFGLIPGYKKAAW